jgi:hypothetical protein
MKHDLQCVRPEHVGVHDRLLNWAKWARPTAHAARISPMFQYYRPKAEDTAASDQGGGPLSSRALVDPNDAALMEERIVKLDEKQRRVIVWWYVWKTPPARFKRKMRMDYSQIEEILHGARNLLAF